ncbi:MAG: exosortase E/protease, VPEID-CTERM system [Paracoccaceae bacterium]|nr:exosortase E/protease, VPEID-CTERM system [Paracoccaceae bacterium]
MHETSSGAKFSYRHRAIAIAALLCVEVLALAIAYQFFATIECHATEANGLCRLLRSMVARALVVFAAFAVLIWARPMPFGRFLARADAYAGRVWRALHLAGFVLLLLPLGMAAGGDLGGIFRLALLPWVLGAILASLGGVLWIAPRAAWHELIAQDGYAPLVVLGIAALVPDVADWVLPLWDWQVLTTLTFNAVRLFLGLFSSVTYADPTGYVIGIKEFSVHIARQCSGVEGVALVTAFVSLYAFIFRTQIRFPHFWVLVLPLAILLSWVLNVVRVGVLILIGAHISPELAVNGFHSYAGWMFFTLLALGIVWAVQSAPWLHIDTVRGKGPRLRQDPMAALILPFVVFMVASVVSQALFAHPELGYPLRAAAMVWVIWYFRAVYLSMPWRPDLIAMIAGIAVGVGWLVLDAGNRAEGEKLAQALATLSGPLLLLWIVARLLGTVLLVPMVEELFFRGYLLTRLDRGGLGMRLLAIAASSAVFAALHGRWLAAGLAGVALALVMLRRGRVSDAITAHVCANLVVALWALATNDFSRI